MIAEIVLAVLEVDVASAVIVNGKIVYREDDDDCYSNEGFPAYRVADELSEALGSPVSTVHLTYADLEGGREEWNFDELAKAALFKAGPHAI